MKASDHLDLPPRIDETRRVYLGANELAGYKDFERDSVFELFGEGQQITAANAAALSGKLMQYANGAIYIDKERTAWHEVHTNKLEELGEYLEAAKGRPTLVMYSFRHDVARIRSYLGREYKIYDTATPDFFTRWNRRELQVLLGHPKSMGHGLNMQDGGDLIAWFGNTWSSELYRQAIARLDRQGQARHVLNSRFASVGTIDERAIDKVDGKIEKEDTFMKYIKAVVREYIPNAA
jgi:SNF2 family DNA or RNA helicase